MEIFQYKKEIKKLKPLEGGCTYHSQRWAKEISNKKLLAIVSKYSNTYVCRETIINSFKELFDAQEDYRVPFLLTMIWGYDSTGYGPFRTNAFLSDSQNLSIIKSSFHAVKVNDIDTAFVELSKIKGLSISYISKLLYFAGRGKGLEDYPLIFDIRVATSLVKLASDGVFNKLIKVQPSNKLDDYKAYNKLLHGWAKKMRVSGDQIEFFLFEQKFTISK